MRGTCRINLLPPGTGNVIARRPATLDAADQVVVLDDGQVTGIGTPAALLRSGGAFARIHDQYDQARGRRLAGSATTGG